MAGKKKEIPLLGSSAEDLRIELEVKECKRNGYELKRIFLGKGNYAKVYLAKVTAEKLKSNHKLKSMQKKNKSCEVAVKIVNVETASHAYINKFLPREVAAMSLNYENPNVVKMLDFFATPKRVYIVLEYAKGGDLLRFVNKSDGGFNEALSEETDDGRSKYGLPERRAREIFADVAHAVRHMHDVVGVAHRDLKCENILLMSENGVGKAKVSDFGFAALGKSEHREASGREAVVERSSMLRNTHCGSFAYASPEVLLKTPNYDARAADMWSLGVVLFALVQGSLPFQETSAKGVLESMKKSLFLKPSSSNEYKRLLRALLRKKPAQRLTASSLLNHPWLQLAGFTQQTNDSKGSSEESLSAEKTAKRKIRSHRPSNFDRPEFVTYCIRQSRTVSKDNQMSLMRLKRTTPFGQDTVVASSTNSSFSVETRKRRSLESSVKRNKRPNTGTSSSNRASVIRYNLTKPELMSHNSPLKPDNNSNEPMNDQYWGPKIEYFLPVPHPSGAIPFLSQSEHVASDNSKQPQQNRLLRRPQFSLFDKIYDWHASNTFNDGK